ncbi:MAG: DUF2905 domain-containing protein [Chloroflexi bacterium]|nr:DUF2905 domain-containing protein [Chloroflexota bacterium]
MEDIGKLIIALGIVLVLVGGGLLLLGKVSGFGKLPGDIVIQRDNFTCLFPLASSILLSLALTIAINFIFRLLNK